MAGLIENNAGEGNYCLVVYKYYSNKSTGWVNLEHEIYAFKQAAKDKVKIVNLSGNGPFFDDEEYTAIRDNPRTMFVVAAGNEGRNLDLFPTYPANYGLNNEFVVGSVSPNNEISDFSSYGSKITLFEMGENVNVMTPKGYDIMSGTSVSTAIFTGKLIRNILSAVQPLR